jgi:5'-nucleotidase
MTRASRVLLLAAGFLLATCAHVEPPATVRLRILAFNDFHGHLEPPPQGLVVADEAAPGKTRRIPAGGVAHLAGALRDLRRGEPHAVVVAAGDLVGASPIVSSLLHDEPTVDALSRAGLEASSVGNHEFDHGYRELLRLQSMARFQWLAANVIDTATGRALLPPYVVREYGGIPVAFVGAVLRSTPQIVSPNGIRGLQFRDEAASVNALVPELRARGVEAIVLLIHQGGRSTTPAGATGCDDFDGPIVAIMKRLDPAVDLVVSGHTHEAYVCRVDGRLVTSAGSFGRLVTAIDVTLDRGTRDVVSASARNHVVDPARFAPDAAIEAEVRRVAKLSEDRAGRVVGRIVGEFTQATGAAGESNLGDLVADAHLAAMREAGAEVAFTNRGGLRAPLAARRPGGEVTFGDVFASQPFGNTLVAMTLSGEQLLRLLESQWRSAAVNDARVLQVAGLAYAWDGTRPRGRRVVPGSVRIGEKPLDPAASYRVAVNSYLAEGGDGFALFTQGTDRVGGPPDAEALERYIGGRTLRAEPPGARITRIDR